MTETKKAYLAGIFDVRGQFDIRTRVRGKHGTIVYSCYVRIAGSREKGWVKVLRDSSKYYGGSIQWPGKSKAFGIEVLEWQLGAINGEKLARDILPYLVGRKEEVKQWLIMRDVINGVAARTKFRRSELDDKLLREAYMAWRKSLGIKRELSRKLP